VKASLMAEAMEIDVNSELRNRRFAVDRGGRFAVSQSGARWII
jgi:hypothetical protein